jgi:hypothetical protein
MKSVSTMMSVSTVTVTISSAVSSIVSSTTIVTTSVSMSGVDVDGMGEVDKMSLLRVAEDDLSSVALTEDMRDMMKNVWSDHWVESSMSQTHDRQQS